MADPLEGKKKFTFTRDQIIYADTVDEAKEIFKKMWDNTQEEFNCKHPTEHFGIIQGGKQ